MIEATQAKPVRLVSGGSSILRGIGAWVFLAGVVTLFYCLFSFDTTVQVPTEQVLGQTVGGGRVYNIGLMQERMYGLIASVGVAGVGVRFGYLGRRRYAPQQTPRA